MRSSVRRIVAVPPIAGLPHLGQVVRLDDGSAARGLRVQRREQLVERLTGCDVPPVVPVVAPRLDDVAALEAPLEPPQLDVGQVLEQLDRRPAGRQPAGPAAHRLGARRAC